MTTEPARGADVGAQGVVHKVVPPHQADQQLAACRAARVEQGVGFRHVAVGSRGGSR